MARKRTIEVLEAGKAFATVFPSYNAVYDGVYLSNWNDMLERLQNPVKIAMSGKDWQKLKDTNARVALSYKFKNGGYDTGACPLARDIENGNTKPCRAEGVPRPAVYNAIAIDADGPKGGKLDDDFDEKVIDVLKDYEFFMHATISSNKEQQRRRIVIPLEKPITLDVREAFIRFFGDKVGITNIDEACTHPKQMMCFPVYIEDDYNYHNTGKMLNAVEWLPSGWESIESWPVWPGKKEVKKRHVSCGRKIYEESGEWKPVFDKNKIHNAYNKTYRISDILKKSGKYEHTGERRWSHTYDTAKDGIKVTNDSILYCYYGNDLLSGYGDLDAFEVATILFHGSLDDKANWSAMYREAVADDNVRKTMIASVAGEDLPAEAETWAEMYDSTEEGIAQRCMSLFPHKMRNNKWMKYTNGIYKEVKPEAIIPDVLRTIRVAAALQPDDEAIQAMVGKNSSARNIREIWGGILAEQQPKEEQWENQPWLMHFSDYTIDLKAYCEGRDYKLEHNPDYMLTQTTGYPFSDIENVDSDVFSDVLESIEVYIPDEELRNYLNMAIGRALCGVACTEDKCLWMLSASSGRDGGNGKSTLLDAIKGALGGVNPTSYYTEIPGSYLYYSMVERNPEGPTSMLMTMRNKRFVQFTEIEGKRTLDTGKFKIFTSAGNITGQNKYENATTFSAKCCCFLDCNSMPQLQKREYSILRRSRVVPFDAELRANGEVKAKWQHNHEYHVAMMCWLLLGLKAWYDNGRKLDDDIKSSPKACYDRCMIWYTSFEDPNEFFEDYYKVTGNDKDYLILDECYNEYKSQCYDKGATINAFKSAEGLWLAEHGITKKAKRVVDKYTGLRRMCYVGVKLITGQDTSKWAVTPVEVVKTSDIPNNDIVKSNVVKQPELVFENAI